MFCVVNTTTFQMPRHPSCRLQQSSACCRGNPAGAEHLRASLPHLPEVVSRATGAPGPLSGPSPRQPVPVRPVRPSDADSQQARGARARAHWGAAIHLRPLPLQRQAAGQSAAALQGEARRARLRRRRAPAPLVHTRGRPTLHQTRPAAAHADQHSHRRLFLPPSSSPVAARPGGMEGFIAPPPHHHPPLSEATPPSFILLLLAVLQQTVLPRLPRFKNFFLTAPLVLLFVLWTLKMDVKLWNVSEAPPPPYQNVTCCRRSQTTNVLNY